MIARVSSMRGKLAPAILLGILQLGDLLSTRLALNHGAIEANFFVSSFGLWEVKLVCLIVIAIFAWHTRRPSRIWFLCAFYLCVVGWNLSLLRR